MEIKVVNLCKSYGDKKVLENVNMLFDDMAPTCIMAPSGRGKTTLLNIIMGLTTADSGHVELTGPDKFSAVFQEDRLAEELSAVMNLAITSQTPDRVEILKLLTGMGLEKEDCIRPTGRLSGGQKRRVAIARALYADSRRIIMDEPFKGLDQNTKADVIEQINTRLAGRLLLVVTHDISDADRLRARVVKL